MADPEEDKKVRRPISFRLRPDDRKRFMVIASARGLTPGQLARQLVARDLDLILRSSTDRRRIENGEVLGKVLGALGRISHELSQWASATQGRPDDSDAVRELRRMGADLDRVIEAILTTIRKKAE